MLLKKRVDDSVFSNSKHNKLKNNNDNKRLSVNTVCKYFLFFLFCCQSNIHVISSASDDFVNCWTSDSVRLQPSRDCTYSSTETVCRVEVQRIPCECSPGISAIAIELDVGWMRSFLYIPRPSGGWNPKL